MTMKSTVTVRKCDNYEPARVRAVLENVLDDLGGPGSFVSRGDRVLLKPNLLRSASPEGAVVTHPSFVEAMASIVIDCGARPFIGDSPPVGKLPRVLSKSGYDSFMARMGIQAVPFLEKAPLEFGDGRIFKRIDLAKEIFDFDRVISLPKLKTHTQMVLTLAVKNLFGAVIGTDKMDWHLRAGKDFDTFATVLVQIFERINPAVSVIDGILGMEGNGPNSGQPRQIGIVAASTDPVALDSVVCRLVGVPLNLLRTCHVGQQLGLGVADKSSIECVGDALNGFPLKDFLRPKSATMLWNLSYWNPVRRFLENHIMTKPDIDVEACQTCGICQTHCPPGAISERSGRMVIDRKKCISCFCCHELCTNDAVRIVQPFLSRYLSKVTR